jgi:hypothetical protein
MVASLTPEALQYYPIKYYVCLIHVHQVIQRSTLSNFNGPDVLHHLGLKTRTGIGHTTLQLYMHTSTHL